MTQLIEALKHSQTGELTLIFFAAMLPVLEVRFAIPFGIGQLGLNPWATFAVSVLGSLVPAPFIIVFIRRIFAWLRTKSARTERLVSWCERKAAGKQKRVQRVTFFALVIFVAIPLPGAGTWMGALVAAMLDMRLRRAMPSIALGALLEGLLMLAITVGFAALF